MKNSQFPIVSVPDLKNTDETIGFDRFLLESNPGWCGLLRRCLPFELPPGMFQTLSRPDRDILLLVQRKGPGMLAKAVMSGSLEALRKDPNGPVSLHGVIQEIYAPLIAGQFENN